MDTNWIYAGRCRNCGRREGWHFGQSGNISGVAFLERMEEKLVKGSMNYCDCCKVNVVHDVLFYGDQKDFINLLDDIEKNH